MMCRSIKPAKASTSETIRMRHWIDVDVISLPSLVVGVSPTAMSLSSVNVPAVAGDTDD